MIKFNPNKKSLLPSLLLQAIETRKQQQRRNKAIEKIIALQNTQPAVSLETIEQIKHDNRS